MNTPSADSAKSHGANNDCIGYVKTISKLILKYLYSLCSKLAKALQVTSSEHPRKILEVVVAKEISRISVARYPKMWVLFQ